MKKLLVFIISLPLFISCRGTGSSSSNYSDPDSSEIDSSEYYGGSSYSDPAPATPQVSLVGTENVEAQQYRYFDNYDGTGYMKPTSNYRVFTIKYYSDGSANISGFMGIHASRIDGYDYEVGEGNSVWAFNANNLN